MQPRDIIRILAVVFFATVVRAACGLTLAHLGVMTVIVLDFAYGILRAPRE